MADIKDAKERQTWNERDAVIRAAQTFPEMREALQPAFNDAMVSFARVATGSYVWFSADHKEATMKLVNMFEKMMLKAPDSQRGTGADITRENMFQAVLDNKLSVDQAKGLLDVLNMIDGRDSEFDDDGKKTKGFTINLAALES